MTPGATRKEVLSQTSIFVDDNYTEQGLPQIKKNKKRVAIVDDMPELCAAYSIALVRRGHDVAFRAVCGEDIVRAVRDGLDVDAIVMDYQLRGINGFDAARKVLGHKPTVRIIIASADPSIKDEASAAGFQFLTKPFSVDVLMRYVEST